MKLTWNDLLIQNIPISDAEDWLTPWAPLVSGKFAPVFLSKFGDWFLRRPDGSTDELSVIAGTLQRIASTPEEFAALVNQKKWQEEHLLSFQVFQLHQRGLIPSAGQCYGFAPHPTFTGRIDLDHVQILSIRVWQSLAAQCFFPTAP